MLVSSVSGEGQVRRTKGEQRERLIIPTRITIDCDKLRLGCVMRYMVPSET